MKAAERLSRAHYRDAALYDRRYRRRKVDLAHYVALVSQRPGHWLELGAGTGRVTLAVAPVVGRLTAIEREAGLCQRLRAIAPQNVSVRRADFLRAALPSRLDGVMAPFNIFSHVLDAGELVAFLARLRRHVRPGGVLAFDLPMPQPSVLGRDPDRVYRVGHARGPDGLRYAYSESFDYDAATQQLLVVAHYDVCDAHGRVRRGDARSFVLPLLQRMYFPAELRFIVERVGYRVKVHAGGFSGEPLDRDSESQVLVLERRA